VARIRTIKPEITESQSIGRLSREARLLFILLWTIVDDTGRARASARFLASRLYPYDGDVNERIEGWLTELTSAGHVRLYDIDGGAYLDIPKWLKHQKIDHPSPSRLPEFREASRGLANTPETFAPHTLDLGPVPRTEDLGPAADAAHAQELSHAEQFKLPKDWQPSQASRDHAIDKGVDPTTVTESFTDWFTEGRGKREKRTAAGWEKRYRIWCNRDAEHKPVAGKVRSASGGSEAGAFARAAARLDGDEPVR
jgi:hypothetical protein